MVDSKINWILLVIQIQVKDSTVQRSNTQLGPSLLYPLSPREGCEGNKDERCHHQELHCGTELICPNTSFYEFHNSHFEKYFHVEIYLLSTDTDWAVPPSDHTRTDRSPPRTQPCPRTQPRTWPPARIGRPGRHRTRPRDRRPPAGWTPGKSPESVHSVAGTLRRGNWWR